MSPQLQADISTFLDGPNSGRLGLPIARVAQPSAWCDLAPLASTDVRLIPCTVQHTAGGAGSYACGMGAGSEVMQRITVPMVKGMLAELLLSSGGARRLSVAVTAAPCRHFKAISWG